MTPEEAIQIVQERFPFKGYMDSETSKYLNIAKTVLRYLEPGDTILDFGSGPCDKTAILQTLGFKCSAYDDLQDYWHMIDGNRDKILAFAKEFGIDFKLASNDRVLFAEGSFDMLLMNDIIEHLHDSPRDLLNDLLEFVKPGGYFLATVPNAVSIRKRLWVLFGKTNLPRFEYYYWYPGSWRGHIREYTRDDLTKLSEYLNLDIVELRGCHHMLRSLPSVVRPIYLGITSVIAGSKDSWLLVAKKRTGWVPRKTLPQNELRKTYELLQGMIHN